MTCLPGLLQCIRPIAMQLQDLSTVDEAAAAYKIPDWFKARGYTIGNPIVTPTGNLGGVKGNLQVIYNELKK